MKLIYIPSGPKNLKALFPSINFDDVGEYYLQLKSAIPATLATSVKYVVGKPCEDLRIHFLNGCGTIDGLNFHEVRVINQQRSERWRRSPSAPVSKPEHAVMRFNIDSNDTYSAVSDFYPESAMPWIEELFLSPRAWIEHKGIQGQPDSYLPIVISDTDFEKLKAEDRYIYRVGIEFTLSHSKFTLR